MSRSKRDDVLAAASACFYEQGIASSGVDAIAERAQVSKRTLYNHFDSKDELVVAHLQRVEARWRDRLACALAGIDDPLERLEQYVIAYVNASYVDVEDPEQRGCALINAAAELPTDHVGLAIVRASKQRVHDEVLALLVALDHPSPGEAAGAIAAMMEGGCTLAGVERDAIDVTPLLDAVRALAVPVAA